MKKIVLAIITILALTSCSAVEPKPTPTPEPTEIPYEQYDFGKRYKVNDLTGSNIVSDDVISLYLSYVDALKIIDSQITPSDFIDVYDEESTDGINENDTKYGMRLKGNSCNMYIFKRNENIYSWEISYNMESDFEYIKDIYAAAIMVAHNNSISADEARSQAQPVIDANNGTIYGKHFIVNNTYEVYSAVYGPSDDFKFNNLLVFDESKMTPTDQALSKYTQLAYETAANGKMNKGTKGVVHGTVDTLTLDNVMCLGPKVYFMMTDDNGQQYKMYYDCTKIPHMFEKGDSYNFYYTVEDDASVSEIGMPLCSIDWYAE